MKLISEDRIELVLISNYTQDKKPSADILSTMTNRNSVGSYFWGRDTRTAEASKWRTTAQRKDLRSCVCSFKRKMPYNLFKKQ